jgi:hypothetical protein
VLWKTIGIHSILGLPSPHEEMYVQVLGYDEDDVLFLIVGESAYMVQLKSRQSRRLHFSYCHPFTSFFAPGDCTC